MFLTIGDLLTLTKEDTMAYYRKPKTTKVKSAHPKNNPFSRDKRRNIPDAWEDILRSDVRSKSWKDNKKVKQYG